MRSRYPAAADDVLRDGLLQDATESVMGRSREGGDAAEFRGLLAIGGNPRKVAFSRYFAEMTVRGARRPEVGEGV